MTHPISFRTAPSAGALYPLVLYLVTGGVSYLTAGIYRFAPNQHALSMIGEGDRSRRPGRRGPRPCGPGAKRNA